LASARPDSSIGVNKQLDINLLLEITVTRQIIRPV
jgi:hypothetical protein